MRTRAVSSRLHPARIGERLQLNLGAPYTNRVRNSAPAQELVELAILIPLLMLIAFGVLDLGRVFHASITIENAAREGARFGTFDPFDTAGIVAATQAEAQSSGIDLSGSTITVACPDGACGSGLPVRVTIQYPFQLVMGGHVPQSNSHIRRRSGDDVALSALRRNRLQRGQDLLEYALVLPIMLLILMSILDLGRVVYVYSALHNSVRDGARYGIINPTDAAGIEALVRTKAVGLDPIDLTVTVMQPDQDTIRVGATYLFAVVSPVFSVMVGGSPWPVGSQATMRVEG